MVIPTVQTTETTEHQELSTFPVRLVWQTSQRNVFLEPMQQHTPPSRNRRPMQQSQYQKQDTQIITSESVVAAAQALN